MLRGAALLLSLFLLASTGCAAVRPWERGRLAKPKMQLDPSPEATLFEQLITVLWTATTTANRRSTTT